MGNSHNFSCIMSNIMTDFSNGIDKVVNDVAVASKAATDAGLEILGEGVVRFTFQLVFEAAVNALL